MSTLRSKFNTLPPEAILIILLFIINLILVSPELLPSYQEINPHDATKYIDSGRQLIDGGEFREISRAPTLSLVYAIIYLFVRHTSDWFVLSAGIGNVFLFTIVWFSTLYFGLRFKDDVHPYILAGFIFLSPAVVIILGNPSDALYAALSAIALAKTIDFYRSKDLRDLVKASIFIGLAFATRLDGLYLSPLFIIITLAIGFRKVNIGKLLAAAIIPGILAAGSFVLIRGVTTGDYSTGYGGIAYASLSWYATPDSPGIITDSGGEVEALFGTPQENQGSAIAAFLSNPTAVLNQVIGNLKGIPSALFQGYGGKKFSPLLFLLALGGVIALIKKKSYANLLIFLLWPMSIILYIPYYIRTGYFIISFFIPLLLGAIGLAFVLSRERGKVERIVILSVLAAFSLYSLLDTKPAFLAVGVLSIATLILIWAVQELYPTRVETELIGLFIALCAGVFLHPPYSFPQAWAVGASSQERAIHFMEDVLKRGSAVATYVPKPIVAARMNEVFLWTVPSGENADEAFGQWIEDNKIQALFIEPVFISGYPDKWKVIEAHIGTLLEREFLADPGSVQVFIVQE